MREVHGRFEFPVVALPGVGHMPAPGEDEKKAVRVFYVGATQRLVVGVGGNQGFAARLLKSPMSEWRIQ